MLFHEIIPSDLVQRRNENLSKYCNCNLLFVYPLNWTQTLSGLCELLLFTFFLTRLSHIADDVKIYFLQLFLSPWWVFHVSDRSQRHICWSVIWSIEWQFIVRLLIDSDCAAHESELRSENVQFVYSSECLTQPGVRMNRTRWTDVNHSLGQLLMRSSKFLTTCRN